MGNSNNSNFSESKFSKFISGKGFYVALGICLLGTAAAAWVAIDSTKQQVENDNSKILYNSSSIVSSSVGTQNTDPYYDFGTSDWELAGNPINDVDVSSSSVASSSSQKPASSSSQKPASSSSKQAMAAQTPTAYTMPIEAQVFAPYSNGQLVKNVTLNEWRTHNGVDIKSPAGTQVKSIADGKVSKIYTDPMWGTVIEVEHSGKIVSLYCGLSETVKVKKGDSIKLGAVLGVVDKIPSEVSLESHLHFEMKKDGKYMDPMSVMGKVANAD